MRKDVPSSYRMAEIAKEYEKHERELRRLCKVKNGCIVFDIGSDYNIHLSRCDTPEKILEWVAHLCEKIWITPDLIQRFIDLAARHNKINYDVGA